MQNVYLSKYWKFLLITVSQVLLGSCLSVADVQPNQSTPVQVNTTPTAVQVNTTLTALVISERNKEMQAFTEKEMARAKSLLSFENTNIQVHERDPLLDANDIGALASWGFESTDPYAVVSIYLFESVDQQTPAVELLDATVPQNGTRVLYGSNGTLLFYGYTYIDGSHGDAIDAKYGLSNLIQAFSGEE